jgi:hypothetical protein
MALTKYTRAESYEVIQEEGEKIASLAEAEQKEDKREDAEAKAEDTSPPRSP